MKINNKHTHRNLSWYFHRPAYWFINILIFIIFLVLVASLFSFFTYKETVKVNRMYASIDQVSDRIEREIASSSAEIKTLYLLDSDITISKPYISDQLISFTKDVLLTHADIFGIAYAITPKYGARGVYLYKYNNTVKLKELSDIYDKYGTNYYDREWFKKPLIEKKAFIDLPTSNLFSQEVGEFTATYSFPVTNSNHEIYAVAALDIDIKDIVNLIKSEIDFSDTSVFVRVEDNYDRPAYAKFDSDLTPKLLYDNFLIQPVNGEWYIDGLRIYRKESLVFGSIDIITEIDLTKLILIVLSVFIILILLLIALNILLSKILRKKIDKLILPLVDLSNHLENIVDNKNLNKKIESSNIQSIEIQKLFESVEKMRTDILRYIEIQKKFNIKKSELYLAKQIQEMFMSDTIDMSQIKNLDIATHYSSAEDLSGDIYDIRRDKKNNLWILVGDSMGKNSAASIFSLFLLARFRFLISSEISCADIITKLNSYMCKHNKNNMFISCICMKIDFENNKIYISNAGHDKPIIVLKDNQFASLNDGYIVLGIDPNAIYSEDIVDMVNCKNLLLYTDGLSETKSSQGFYGIDKIKNILITSSELSASNQLEKLLEDINLFEDESLAQDDKTAILIKFFGVKCNEK
ncbi:stage II sporulation E family protein [Francisella philomiragia subsp. philomiragia ATCC 25015]|uniref:SpoIIE family protein phosphatase n=1 Tax=Francisella philomiragia TaxID=28110 RepID=UPI0001AF7718|nr:SpoIIE family protein phosphatase [Francisella philomiragia]AJI74191.1 stage II sporulation E family protein [Francisella philomiragia subsp. philomiragia ATCC 25015]EET21815.1 predicted protein [Francisella philomiragia subsp. philomiragia ATCC 25015]MBK2238985.1 SpoIIE family protein phosphatase [Francisella philomiragia]